MIPVLSIEKMRKADALTIKKLNGQGSLLMEHAGTACVQTMMNRYDERLNTMKILVAAGKGNNGGDGLVIARQLISRNIDVNVIFLSHPDTLKGDAAFQFAILKNYSVQWKVLSEENADQLFVNLNQYDVIVDAIYGTGLNSPVRGIGRQLIEEINMCRADVLAVDIPSGLNGNSHRIQDCHVKADVTVTFGALKYCHVLSPAEKYTGEVYVDDITIPETVFEEVCPDMALSELSDLNVLIDPPDPDSHKGSFGHVGVIGGTQEKAGAAIMGAYAALKTGSGLSSVFTVSKSLPASIYFPELMTTYYSEGNMIASLKEFISDKDAILAGPGLGISQNAKDIIKFLLNNYEKPIVLDADVFRNFTLHELKQISTHTHLILTPHPGEMAAFTGLSVNDIQADRLNTIREIISNSNLTVVLKGNQTLTGSGRQVVVNSTGNPGMATAGSGDVLSGIILSLVGQGYSCYDSARLGVLLHGNAGDLAFEKKGRQSMTAMDIVHFISEALYCSESTI